MVTLQRPEDNKNDNWMLRKWRESVTKIINDLLAKAQEFTPSYSASGLMTYTSVTTIRAKYRHRDQSVELYLNFEGTTGGTASNVLQVSLPFNVAPYCSLSATVQDGLGTAISGICYAANNLLCIEKADKSNFGLGANRGAWVSGVVLLS